MKNDNAKSISFRLVTWANWYCWDDNNDRMNNEKDVVLNISAFNKRVYLPNIEQNICTYKKLKQYTQ